MHFMVLSPFFVFLYEPYLNFFKYLLSATMLDNENIKVYKIDIRQFIF